MGNLMTWMKRLCCVTLRSAFWLSCRFLTKKLTWNKEFLHWMILADFFYSPFHFHFLKRHTITGLMCVWEPSEWNKVKERYLDKFIIQYIYRKVREKVLLRSMINITTNLLWRLIDWKRERKKEVDGELEDIFLGNIL